MKKSDAIKLLCEMQDKYIALLRVARTLPDDPKERKEECKRTRNKYPGACALLGGRNGNFHHGFNSGCLAVLRLAIGILERGKLDNEAAIRDFPNLDT